MIEPQQASQIVAKHKCVTQASACLLVVALFPLVASLWIPSVATLGQVIVGSCLFHIGSFESEFSPNLPPTLILFWLHLGLQPCAVKYRHLHLPIEGWQT